MKTTEIIKEILELRKWSRVKLSEEMGYKRPSNIGTLLDRGTNIRTDKLIEMAEIMGCEVIIRDKMGSGKEWRVTVEDK